MYIESLTDCVSIYRVPSSSELDRKYLQNGMSRGDRERDESRSNSVNTMGFGREQSVRELEQIGRQQRYKADLDRQREELEKKRSAEKWREKEEDKDEEKKKQREKEKARDS